MDRQEQQSEHEDSEDGGVGGYDDGDENDDDTDGDADEDVNYENLLAVSQTNWGVISGTAGNGGEREKLKS